MYRQILIDNCDIDLQRILWRSSPADAINEYRLLTVTYGTASAPFLALRVLKQLADDEGASFPLGKRALMESMYIDDALFGADSISQIRLIRDQLVALLKRGHFELRKWSSNAPELLSDIDPHNHGLALEKTVQADAGVKILGITTTCTRLLSVRGGPRGDACSHEADSLIGYFSPVRSSRIHLSRNYTGENIHANALDVGSRLGYSPPGEPDISVA
ncbi:hypothetical protein ALC60_08103 [Trachymyrmex zeteki]|uniref:Reverse transcriptase domain-containing protein n=1 Tax=Mycetomoellerius zeteki TaxID=64791 RepID=A0A151WXZ3_9HYME|nr:hypothetical protein ALC60_08103 [Trachymyrmex zeteki]